MERIRGAAFRRTPDLLAGPTLGRASEWDFMLDVKEIYGENLFNPRSPGGTDPPGILLAGDSPEGEFSSPGTAHFRAYASVIDSALQKYSMERNASPMVGVCVHLDISFLFAPKQPALKKLQKFAHHPDYLQFLSGYFELPPMVSALVSNAVLGDRADSGCAVVFVRFGLRRFAFLLHTIVSHRSDTRGVLIANAALLDEAGPLQDHPVLRWLRHLRRLGVAWPKPALFPPGEP